jgi:hypothetical protein
VYSDSACTTPISAIEGVALSPGGTTNKVIYIKNTGNAPLTLGVTTANWNPTNTAASLVLTWDKQTTVLEPEQTAPSNISVDGSSTISGITSFGFR